MINSNTFIEMHFKVPYKHAEVYAYKETASGFPGGAVVKKPPANAEDTGSSPGPGRSFMPWCN